MAGELLLDDSAITTAVLWLLAGIGVFLTACNMLSSNMEALSSSKLKKMFARASKSKLYGVGIGAVGTAAIQSSGAMTVMVIGFVNAGIMALPLAATVIYGANIGTTITAQIAAIGTFSESGISLPLIFSALAGVGAFISVFAKRERTKVWGGAIAGFGLLFVGLTLMSDSMGHFAGQAEVKEFLASIDNLIVLLLIGVVLTALVQSSSVVTTLAITMVVTGLIDLNQGIYLTMGSNIGSCVVTIFAGMSGGLNAKRTAVIHLLFNVFGVTMFVLVAPFLWTFGISYSDVFGDAFPGAPGIALAMFHTFFNVVTVLVMLPLTESLVALVMKIVPDKAAEEEGEFTPKMYYLNDYMLKTPAVAVQQVMNEIVNMSHIAMENYRSACHMIRTMDFGDMEKFNDNE